jgi:membrane-associated PAP2 superfamily phosphatase
MTTIFAAAPRASFQRPLLLILLLLAAVSLIFVLAPQLDLAFSRLFYDPATGFSAGRATLVESVREAGELATWTILITVAALLPLKVIFPNLPLLISPRKILFVLSSYAIGPGLIVNLVLKDFWGRARPREVVEFAGDATFSRAWWISKECHLNCSFVSGEAASAFCLLTLAFLVRPSWRPVVAVAIFLFAVAVSLARIAAGAHFLSDVLIAWLIVLLVMVGTRQVFLERLPQSFDDRVESAAANLGAALRKRLRPGA